MTFRALALRQSESRNYGLCIVKKREDGAALLVVRWQREKQATLIELKAFVDTLGIQSCNGSVTPLFEA